MVDILEGLLRIQIRLVSVGFLWSVNKDRGMSGPCTATKRIEHTGAVATNG
jgi:hypothetical protein